MGFANHMGDNSNKVREKVVIKGLSNNELKTKKIKTVMGETQMNSLQQ